MLWLILSLVLLLLMAIAFVRYMSATHDTFRKMNIDSPPTNWILGNFAQAFKKGIFEMQLKYYFQFKGKKVYGVYDVRKPVLMIPDPDVAKDIMVKHFNSFVNRRVFFQIDPPFKDNLLFLRDDHWKHVRSIVSPTFSSGRITKMSYHVERHSNRLVEILRAKQESNESFELKKIICHFTLDVIASTGFGLDVNTLENPDNEFAVNAEKCIRGNPLIFFLAFFAPWLLNILLKVGVSFLSKDSLVFFTQAIDSAMENRKQEGQAGKYNDFLDLLIDAEQDSEHAEKGTLTKSEIQAQVLLFLLAGFDTVSTVLSFTLFLLAQHPEYLRMAQKEIDEKTGSESPNHVNVQGLTFLEMCINESMRLYPPGFFLDRVCSEDVTIQGIHIPKDMIVTIPVYAIHHDPDIWPEPEKFQPERFSPENKDSRHPYSYLPFGQGPRNCIGMRLALMELKIALTNVLKTFTPVTCEKAVYPIRLDKFQMKAEDGLWIKLNARK